MVRASSCFVRSKNRAVPIILAWCLFFVVLGWSHHSFAKGDGIKFMGEQGRFHPRLYLDFGFDQNPLRRSSASRTSAQFSEILNAPYFNVRPGMELGITNDSVSFGLLGFVNYNYYINDRLSGLNQLSGKADIYLELFKSSPVKLLIGNYFSRSAGDTYTAEEVFNYLVFQAESGTQRGGAFLSFNNASRIQLTIQPGGKAFTTDVGYQIKFGLFPDANMDYLNQQIFLNVKWKFLPKTALLFESNVEIVSYAQQLNFARASAINRGMYPFKAYLGLLGQFTENLTLTVKVGGGYTFVNEDDTGGVNPQTPKDNYGMVLGSALLTYYFTPTTYLRVGVLHDFYPSMFTNFYHTTAGVVDFATQFAGRFLVKAGAQVGYVQYGELPTNYQGVQYSFARNPSQTSGNTVPNQIVVSGNLSFDWYIFEWWTLGIQTAIEWRESNGNITVNGDVFDLGFFRITAALKTEIAW